LEDWQHYLKSVFILQLNQQQTRTLHLDKCNGSKDEKGPNALTRLVQVQFSGSRGEAEGMGRKSFLPLDVMRKTLFGLVEGALGVEAMLCSAVCPS
jgi:hypothetical protein